LNGDGTVRQFPARPAGNVACCSMQFNLPYFTEVPKCQYIVLSRLCILMKYFWTHEPFWNIKKSLSHCGLSFLAVFRIVRMHCFRMPFKQKIRFLKSGNCMTYHPYLLFILLCKFRIFPAKLLVTFPLSNTLYKNSISFKV
jgi:hypothetical protein